MFRSIALLCQKKYYYIKSLQKKQEAHGPPIAHMNNSSSIILFQKGLL